MTLAAEFASDLNNSITLLHPLGYHATGLIRKLMTYSAQESARQLIHSGFRVEDIKSGLFRIAELGRIELAIESLVLLPKYRPLFSDLDRAYAQWNLEQMRIHLEAHQPA